MPDVQKALAGLSLPVGVTWQSGGQQAQTSTAFGSLIFAMILGLVFVYMVLASQFGSLIHPLTVMSALPLAAIGAVFAMLATRTELTVISMIGILLLMGIATKNSILLVDFIIRYRKEGQGTNGGRISGGARQAPAHPDDHLYPSSWAWFPPPWGWARPGRSVPPWRLQLSGVCSPPPC